MRREVTTAVFTLGATQRPSATRLNFNNSTGTSAVGSYSPAGDSWVGVQDMAGNVWEWVADWYDPRYYDRVTPAADNPQNRVEPTTLRRVLRGGSWGVDQSRVRSANRFYASPNHTNTAIGFRCAVPLNN